MAKLRLVNCCANKRIWMNEVTLCRPVSSCVRQYRGRNSSRLYRHHRSSSAAHHSLQVASLTSRSSSSFTAHIITLAAPITDGVKHRFDVCLSVCLSVYYVPAAVQQQLVLIKKNSRTWTATEIHYLNICLVFVEASSWQMRFLSCCQCNFW